MEIGFVKARGNGQAVQIDCKEDYERMIVFLHRSEGKNESFDFPNIVPSFEECVSKTGNPFFIKILKVGEVVNFSLVSERSVFLMDDRYSFESFCVINEITPEILENVDAYISRPLK